MSNIFYNRNIIGVLLIFLFFSQIGFFYNTWIKKTCDINNSSVSFLNVGQGDAVYIQDSSGVNILVDTGPKDSGVLKQIQSVQNCSKVYIDILILTHPDADHIGEAERLIKKGLVGKVIHNGFLDIDQKDESLLENNLEKIAVSKQMIRAGESVSFKNTKIDFLYPIEKPYIHTTSKKVDDNDFSFVMYVSSFLSTGTTTFLLTGDISKKIESTLLNTYCKKDEIQNTCSLLDVDILKLAHHGSKNSSSFDFLHGTSPDEVVVSAGLHNRYGHPHEDVIRRVTVLFEKHKKPLKIRETFSEGNIVYK